MLLSQEQQTQLIRDVMNELQIKELDGMVTAGNAKHILTRIWIELRDAIAAEEGSAEVAFQAKTNAIAKSQANLYWKLRVVILQSVYDSLKTQFEQKGWL